ncbi:MAG: alkaline phosphatase family protein, partial [Ignavibacteria bacterium]
MKLKTILLLLIFNITILAGNKPYVILISFDGFRWDYLERDISPTLKSIEKEGVRALSLRPSYPSKTFPNHLSIITGMYPENHGIITNYIVDPYN